METSAVVFLSTPLIGLEQVCYLSALLLLSIEWWRPKDGPTSTAEDRLSVGHEEEIEEEDGADKETQLQLLNYNPGRDGEILEDSLGDMDYYDDNGEKEFM